MDAGDRPAMSARDPGWVRSPADLLAGLVGGVLAGLLACALLHDVAFGLASGGALDLSGFGALAQVQRTRGLATWIGLLLAGEQLARGRVLPMRAAIGAAAGALGAGLRLAEVFFGGAWWRNLDPDALEGAWRDLRQNGDLLAFELVASSLTLGLVVFVRSRRPPRRAAELAACLAPPALAVALVGLGPLRELYPGDPGRLAFAAWALGSLLLPTLMVLGVEAGVFMRRRLGAPDARPGP